MPAVDMMYLRDHDRTLYDYYIGGLRHELDDISNEMESIFLDEFNNKIHELIFQVNVLEECVGVVNYNILTDELKEKLLNVVFKAFFLMGFHDLCEEVKSRYDFFSDRLPLDQCGISQLGIMRWYLKALNALGEYQTAYDLGFRLIHTYSYRFSPLEEEEETYRSYIELITLETHFSFGKLQENA